MYIEYDEALKKIAERREIPQREACEILTEVRKGASYFMDGKVLSYDENHTPKYRFEEFDVEGIAVGDGTLIRPPEQPSLSSRLFRWWFPFFPNI